MDTRQIALPMFLDPHHRLMYEMTTLGRDAGAHEGDTVIANRVGTTKDSDGWPMMVFILKVVRKESE